MSPTSAKVLVTVFELNVPEFLDFRWALIGLIGPAYRKLHYTV